MLVGWTFWLVLPASGSGWDGGCAQDSLRAAPLSAPRALVACLAGWSLVVCREDFSFPALFFYRSEAHQIELVGSDFGGLVEGRVPR